MKRGSGWVGVLVLSLGFSWNSGQEQARPPAGIKPDRIETETIKQDLFALVNSEREKEGRSPLRFSNELAALAHRHSADMAESGKMSHTSASGETYEERLVRANFFFSHAGENVAHSETPVAEIIHSSLMDSRDHRQNILDADFDTVGIAVVAVGKPAAFFVTQDFIHALEPLSSETAEARLAGKIREWRRIRSLSNLPFLEEANRLARSLAEARAGEKALPPIPSSMGETHVYFVTTPLPEEINFQSLNIDNPFYHQAGIGVSFGRLKKHPGGAYCVALLLFPKYEYLPPP